MPRKSTHSTFVVPAVQQAEPTGLRVVTALSPAPRRLPSQQTVALVTLGASGAALVATWITDTPAWKPATAHHVVVAVFLVVALTLSHRFPLRVGPNDRAQIGSIPAYLIAALSPAAIAMTAAGLAQFSANMVTRKPRDLRWSDIATDVGRWMLLVLLGSIVSHATILSTSPNFITLALAAGVFVAGDFATFPLLLFRMPRGPSLHILCLAVKDAGPSEALQYLFGFVVAIVAVHVWWAVFFAAIPPLVVHLISYRAHLRLEATRRRLENVADEIDGRSPPTTAHSRRVAELARAVLREMQRYGPEVDRIVQAARIHDIGMADIPADILNRVVPLSGEDWATLRLHPETGADLLVSYSALRSLAPLVRHHHEWWNGTGYPHRLRGEEIPFGSRVIAVAESYDVMICGRSDKPGISRDHAVAILKEGRGVQWDGAIVDAFLRTIGAYLTVPVSVPYLVAGAEHDRYTASGDRELGRSNGSAGSGAMAAKSTRRFSARQLFSDGILLDRATRRVYLHGEELSLTAKAVTLLEFLMLHHDEVCYRDRLLDELWGWDRPAPTRAVDLRIAELRKALRDNPDDPRYIETRIGEGYRFLGSVETPST